ncbi:MAG: DUF1934 domain-containing protein [Ruminococcus sp.]|nr:DUF1934 domain-containing protein [Ruminococcus sp.]
MKDNFLISVTGTQIIDGEKESIKLTTGGEYVTEENTHCIRYKEYDNDNPDICFHNTVRVEGDTLTVIRSGPAQSRLILEKGRRHQCHYNTMFGDLTVGVFTDTVVNCLTEKGGTLRASYTLDFNAGLVSKNEIYIKVTEKEVN